MKPLLILSLLTALTFSQNLVSSTTWSAQVDEYGSSLDTTGGLVKNGTISIGFTLGKMKAEDQWPYVELIGATPEGLEGVTSITVTYSCPKNVHVKLSQPDFGWEGDESYAHYQSTLPATEGFKTVILPLANFAQPTWAPASATKIPMKLSDIAALYFTPVLNEKSGESTRLKIKSVTLQK
jgi:hypothetical protein